MLQLVNFLEINFMLKALFISLLFISLCLQGTAQKADWVQQLRSSDQINTRDIAIDGQGNYFATGTFYDSLFVNTINGEDTLVDLRFGEVFFLKFDSCGSILWAKQFFGQSKTESHQIAINSLGEIVIVGNFSADTDFDPSSNTFNVSPAGGNAIFITRLDNDGNLIRVGRLGGSPGMYLPRVAIDDSNNIYVSAAFSGGFPNTPVDLDPDLNKTSFFTPNNMDGAIVKMDPSGNLDWVYHIRGPGFQILAGDIKTVGTHVSATFRFYGQIAFDTDNGVKHLTASGNVFYDVLTLNLTKDKSLISYSHLIGDKSVYPNTTEIWTNTTLCQTGFFTDTLKNANTGNPISFVSKGLFDSYVSRWKLNGDFMWAQHISSKNRVFIHSSAIRPDAKVYVSGVFRDTVQFGQDTNKRLISPNKNNVFLALIDSTGNFIELQQLDINTGFQNQIEIDSDGDLYGLSSFNSAYLPMYDGDTNLNAPSNESALLFKWTDEQNRVDLGNDTNICFEDSLLLQTNIKPGDQFLWSDGSTNSSLMVKQAGEYHVRVENCGKVFRDSILISQSAQLSLDLGLDTAICVGSSFLLQPSCNNIDSYLWNTGESSKDLIISSEGKYLLTGSDSLGCQTSDSIQVNEIPTPIGLNTMDTTLCGIDSLVLSAGTAGNTFIWNTNEFTQEISVKNSGLFWVRVDNGVCTTRDTVNINMITAEDCLPSILFPNVFTPNNDGVNDYFDLKANNLLSLRVKIYNRWGVLVFEDNSLHPKWDGRSKGLKVLEGSFMLSIEYSYQDWGKSEIIHKEMNSNLMLLR